MKKIICLSLAIILCTGSLFAQKGQAKSASKKTTKEAPAFVPSVEGPEISFEKTVHDYGTIEKGANGDCEFVFTNIGSEPLVLSNVH